MEPEIDISEIIQEWGATYRDEGQTAKDIKKKLFFEDDLSAHFSMRPNASSTFRSTFASATEVLQAFSIPFTPKGNIAFLPWEQRLGEFKLDFLITPDTLWPSYMGFLAELDKPERKNWTFVKWAILELFLPQAEEDFILKVAYKGWQYNGFQAVPVVNATTFVRTLPDAMKSSPLPANASMDGVQLQIAKMIGLGRVTPIVVGAWVKNDPVAFCTQIEQFMRQVENPLRQKIDKLFASEELVDLYVDGRRLKYNLHYRQEADLFLIEKTNARMTKSMSMEGSDQVWGTHPKNRVKPTKVKKGGSFDLQAFDRSVKALKNYNLVLTFEVPEHIVTSEHDTTIDVLDYAVA